MLRSSTSIWLKIQVDVLVGACVQLFSSFVHCWADSNWIAHFQRVSLKPILSNRNVNMVIWKNFSLIIAIFCIPLSFYSYKLVSPCYRKASPQNDTAITFFDSRGCNNVEMPSICFPSLTYQGIMIKLFNLVLIRSEAFSVP